MCVQVDAFDDASVVRSPFGGRNSVVLIATLDQAAFYVVKRTMPLLCSIFAATKDRLHRLSKSAFDALDVCKRARPFQHELPEQARRCHLAGP